MQIIGNIATPFKEKFAIPRQPGLVPNAAGIITMNQGFNNPDSFRGIEQFSHLWLIFQFHAVPVGKWSPLVRPPRLGGNRKVGVFATRSTHRPNNIGMSVVKFEHISTNNHDLKITVSGVDLLNDTPILDIKPYIAYSDNIDANSGYAQEAPVEINVNFSAEAQHQLVAFETQYSGITELIFQVLKQNPKPAYKSDTIFKEYGMQLYDLNIKWTQQHNSILVITIDKLPTPAR